jgi:hypothetical protein
VFVARVSDDISRLVSDDPLIGLYYDHRLDRLEVELLDLVVFGLSELMGVFVYLDRIVS